MQLTRSLICIGAWAGLGLGGLGINGALGAQESGISPAAREAGDAYLRALGAAGQAYLAKDYATALDKLRIADEIHPNIEDTWNMRGAIYADEHAFDKAAEAFKMARKANPSDFWPAYNVAQLSLTQGRYAEASAAFQKLMVFGGHKELLEYKVVFSSLLAGDADTAKPVLDAMKFPCDTPGYYFAHAAWSYAHKDAKQGAYWTSAGLHVFGLTKCASFYDAMAAVQWVPARDPRDGSIPEEKMLSTLGAPTTPESVSPMLAAPKLGL